MSEWNVIHENFHTKHSVLTAPDEHMPYIIQLQIMSIQWAYTETIKLYCIMSKWSSRTSDQFIWLVSEKKTEAVNVYLIKKYIKNSKGEGEGGEKKTKQQQKCYFFLSKSCLWCVLCCFGVSCAPTDASYQFRPAKDKKQRRAFLQSDASGFRCFFIGRQMNKKEQKQHEGRRRMYLCSSQLVLVDNDSRAYSIYDW